MANTLKMAHVNTIRTLLERGWSRRRIARELGIHRETVSRYARIEGTGDSKPAISTPGADPKPAISTPGTRAGRLSSCQPFKDQILEKLEQGLSAQRIHQDLVDEHDFSGSYQSVKRFVRKHKTANPLPFRRMECLPGEEAQVDFGQGALIKREGRKNRRPHLFRVVLSYSRKAYSEVVWRQTTEEFIRCIENAFHHFGGVPKTLVIDNLRAAVTKADWYDPEINPKFDAFARHYGIAVLPTKAYTPRHKGKVESGIKYSQENALKARIFQSLDEQNQFLLKWESGTADQRIHGTTRKHVRQQFEEHEKSALLPLPRDRFPFFHEAERIVHRDGHIALEQAFYSLPPEHLGRKVWVRWDSHLVRVFDQRFQQIAVHAKVTPGSFSTDQAHIASEKISGIEKGASFLLGRAVRIGPESGRWAQALIEQRGLQGIRVITLRAQWHDSSVLVA